MTAWLNTVLKIQDLDMAMLRLMRVKNKRRAELNNIHSLRKDLEQQLLKKEHDVLELKKEIKLAEGTIMDLEERVKKLEGQQAAVKRVDEFNALSQEITSTQQEMMRTRHRVSDLSERLESEEEVLENIRESLSSTTESSQALEAEILEGISKINEEGRTLQSEREIIAKEADVEVLHIYERLFGNRRDRVVVPVENRTCSGCHIVLTAQHENLVRRGERLVFCEHCSRIHYWQEAEQLEEVAGAPKRRRRRKATA